MDSPVRLPEWLSSARLSQPQTFFLQALLLAQDAVRPIRQNGYNRMVETLFERKTGSDAKPSLFFQCLPQGVARIVVKHCFGCAGQKKTANRFLDCRFLIP
ncbi:MAG: hypothetical protein IJS54_06245 [Desulfovibrio sp.]|nr:hypothetical protein [Desulfovibrio sp.]